ncbi:MAG: hypothetical protein ACREPQ_04515 [Rhodanobacter sp.]
MTPRPRHLLLLYALALPCSLLHAQQTTTLQQHMGNSDFHESGLDKLNPAELKHLQQWLSAHAAELAAAVPASEAASASAAAGKPAKSGGGLSHHDASASKAGIPNNTVVNRLAGSFKGWGPHTTFTLQNGQQWRVVDDSDLTTGKTLEDPEVTIKPGFMGSWLLMVKGYNASARVAPVN